jgi:hypothetical protein
MGMSDYDELKRLAKAVAGISPSEIIGLISRLKEQQATIQRLEAERLIMRKGLCAVDALIDNSKGIAGLHLNRDIAFWDQLQTGGKCESWLLDFDAAMLVAVKSITGNNNDN